MKNEWMKKQMSKTEWITKTQWITKIQWITKTQRMTKTQWKNDKEWMKERTNDYDWMNKQMNEWQRLNKWLNELQILPEDSMLVHWQPCPLILVSKAFWKLFCPSTRRPQRCRCWPTAWRISQWRGSWNKTKQFYKNTILQLHKSWTKSYDSFRTTPIRTQWTLTLGDVLVFVFLQENEENRG